MAWFDWNFLKRKKEAPQDSITAWNSLQKAVSEQQTKISQENFENGYHHHKVFNDIFQQEYEMGYEIVKVDVSKNTSSARVPAPHIGIMENNNMTDNIFTQAEIGNINYLKSYFERVYRDMVNEILPVSEVNSSCMDGHIIISGGVFSNLFHGMKEEGDVDFFVYDYFNFNNTDFVMKLNEHGWRQTSPDTKYKVLPYIVNTYKHFNGKANLIVTNHTTPKDVVNEFDFVHCTPYYKPYDSKFCLTKKAYNAIVNRELILQHPSRSVPKDYYQRVNKWKERGYSFKLDI